MLECGIVWFLAVDLGTVPSEFIRDLRETSFITYDIDIACRNDEGRYHPSSIETLCIGSWLFVDL